MKTGAIIDLAHWRHTAAGQALRQWEQTQADRAVADCFGYHAVQLGAADIPLLRNSRIQHHWLADVATVSGAATGAPHAAAPAHQSNPYPPNVFADTEDTAHTPSKQGHPALVLDATALPLADACIDLLVLPHTLETSTDPHAVLREAARVLVPEGRLLLFGFNPTSLWGLQQRLRTLRHAPPLIACTNDWIHLHRLRDWLGLLNLDIAGGCFGSYRPALHSPAWLRRLHWMELAGDRWWPVLGGVYMLEAVKHIHGVHMIHPRWSVARQGRRSVLPVAPRQQRPADAATRIAGETSRL